MKLTMYMKHTKVTLQEARKRDQDNGEDSDKGVRGGAHFGGEAREATQWPIPDNVSGQMGRLRRDDVGTLAQLK
jgi:hypothetical protein